MRNWLVRQALFAGTLMSIFSAPARAQVDFSGEWAPRIYEEQLERIPGRELGNYLGLPINEAARQRGEAYQGSLLTLPELQCRPMGRRRSDDHDDAPERRIYRKERDSPQRLGDVRRTLDSAWKLDDSGDNRDRSGVFDRAFHSDFGL